MNLNDIASFLVTGKSGDEIFHAGEIAAEMYVVRQGQIELSRPLSGAVSTVVRLQAGEFFGEEALIEHQPRVVSARAVTDYQLIKLDATAFDQIVREDPGIAVQIIRGLLHRAAAAIDVEARAAQSRRAAAQSPGQPHRESLSPRDPPGEPVLVDTATAKTFPIAGDGELTIGRASRAGTFKPAIDLSELDPKKTLSRNHARLLKRGDEVYLRAVAEAGNGTFVNGRRVGVSPVRLKEGDRVCFGLVETVFSYR